MRSKTLLSGLFVIAMVFILAMPVNAEVMIKQVTHTDEFSMMGQTQPANDETTTMWFGDGVARMDQADTSSWIVISEKNTIYALDHKNKTYAELPLSGAKAEGGMPPGMTEGMSAEEAAKMKEMMGGMMGSMMKMDVTVTPTDETQKIKDWDCKKYMVDMKMGMGNTKTETWATEDIDIDMELFKSVSKVFMSAMPGYEDIMKEMEKVKGVTIKSVGVANMMGTEVKTTTDVVEVKKADAPKGSFVIPEGYTKSQ